MNALRFNIVEHLPGRRSRLIGRAQIRRKEAVQSASQDLWFTIYGVSGPKSAISTVVAELCLDIYYEAKTRLLKIRYVEYSPCVRLITIVACFIAFSDRFPASAGEKSSRSAGNGYLSTCVARRYGIGCYKNGILKLKMSLLTPKIFKHAVDLPRFHYPRHSILLGFFSAEST